MTEWKPEAGKDAVVRVRAVSSGGEVAWLEGGGSSPIFALRPLPPALSAEDALRDPSDADVASAYSAWRNHPGSNPEAVGCAIADFLARRRSTPPAAAVPQDSAWQPATPRDTTAQDSAWVPKAGDRVRTKWVRDISGEPIRGVVTYIGASGDVIYKIDNGGGVGSALPSWLEADPEPATPRDTTALRDAVVEAAIVWRRKGVANNGMGRDLKEYYRLRDATDALLSAEAPADPTPKESMAETLWPFIKHGMRGCERLEWAKVNRGSAAWDMAMHAAEAALSVLGDRGRG